MASGETVAARIRHARRHVLELDDPGREEPATAPPPEPPGPRWQATLIVRDEVTDDDAPMLADADLVIMQALPHPQAQTAMTALGLPDDATNWLGRIGGEMVGVVADGELRWVTLATTQIERATAPNGVDVLQHVTRQENHQRGGD
jgi:hypothetical protein